MNKELKSFYALVTVQEVKNSGEWENPLRGRARWVERGEMAKTNRNWSFCKGF